MMTGKTLEAGDTVRWDHSQGSSTGKIVRKVTSPTKIKNHKVTGTKDDPEYIVQSDRTGAKAAHRPGALRKV